MKKGNLSIIVVLLFVALVIAVVITLIFTGVEEKDIKEVSIYKSKPAPVEFNVMENKEFIDNLMKITNYSNYLSDKVDENDTFNGFYFYAFKDDKITIDSLTRSDKISIAYNYFMNDSKAFNEYVKDKMVENSNSFYLSKKLIDEYIQKVFGKEITIEARDFTYLGKTVSYDADKECWIMPMGLGGRYPYKISAVYKLVDTGEKMEIYERAIYVDYETENGKDYTVLHFKTGKKSKILTTNFNDVKNWTLENINAYVISADDKSDLNERVMSKYFSSGTKYKHTFKKETIDGKTYYYWETSEKIK